MEGNGWYLTGLKDMTMKSRELATEGEARALSKQRRGSFRRDRVVHATHNGGRKGQRVASPSRSRLVRSFVLRIARCMKEGSLAKRFHLSSEKCHVGESA